MPNAEQSPVPLTLTSLEQQRERVAGIIEKVSTFSTVQTQETTFERFHRLQTYEDTLSQHIEIFTSSDVIQGYQPILQQVLAGREFMDETDYGKVIEVYNEKVHSEFEAKKHPIAAQKEVAIVQPASGEKMVTKRKKEQALLPITLQDINANLQKTLALTVVTQQTRDLYPPSSRNTAFQRDVENLAVLVDHAEKGTLHRPSITELMQTGPNRAEIVNSYAMSGIRLLVAKHVVPKGNLQAENLGTAVKIATELNRLEHRLGGEGNEIIKNTFHRLSHLERTLLFNHMSASKKAEYDFPDIDVCAPGEIAQYVKILVQEYT